MSTDRRRELRGMILSAQGFVDGRLQIDAAGRIAAIEGTPATAAEARASGQPRILPGFIDLHVHGGGGRDIMDGGDAVHQIATRHAAHGTTALLATTMTAPADDLDLARRRMKEMTQ